MEFHNFNYVFSKMVYPAGEPHIELNGEYVDIEAIHDDDVIVVPHCRNFNDLGILVAGAEAIYPMQVTWFIPYFPFGRHDRRRFTGDGLEIRVAMDMVSHLDVVTMDPHSDVLGMMRHIPQYEVVDYMEKKMDLFQGSPVIVIPDQGATKKAMTWMKGREWVQGYKVRDPATGKLSGFSVDITTSHGNHLSSDHNCLIVDDICDGGGTFIGLAAKLREKMGINNIELAVSHGLFTKGLDELYKSFTRVAAIDTYLAYKEIYRRSAKI